LMSQRVDPTAQGKLQGAINSLRALTGMAGPLLFTQVFSAAIAPGARLHLPGAPYLLASVLLLGSLLLALSVVKHVAAATSAAGSKTVGETP
jgi:DHA1 family tetracycline resistance protein-like MFS transporter